ncbi:MAG: alpha/beta fold hydrolase [Bacteroidales bacterium]|nr:alpha/beta fold hydrolase [Bacteroidales bacterium]
MNRLLAYPFQSHFKDVSGIKIHYLDEGDPDAPALIFLHGVPTWSYSFRRIIPDCVAAGLRVIVPDLPGFGLSHKPIDKQIFSLRWMVAHVAEFIDLMKVDRPVLFAHDWGVLIGLLLAAEADNPFSGMILSNGFLPVPGVRAPWLFRIWRTFARYSPLLPIGMIVNLGSKRRLSRKEKQGYNYPFNSMKEKGAVRIMPGLIPVGNRNGIEVIEKAWSQLEEWDKPLLTIFGDGDPITRGGEKIIQTRIPGAWNQDHKILKGGHFLQEDAPEEIARTIIRFMEKKR